MYTYNDNFGFGGLQVNETELMKQELLKLKDQNKQAIESQGRVGSGNINRIYTNNLDVQKLNNKIADRYTSRDVRDRYYYNQIPAQAETAIEYVNGVPVEEASTASTEFNPQALQSAQSSVNAQQQAEAVQAIKTMAKENQLSTDLQEANTERSINDVTGNLDNKGMERFQQQMLAGGIAAEPEKEVGFWNNLFNNDRLKRALLVSGVQLAAGAIGGLSSRDLGLLALEGAVKGFTANPGKKEALELADKYMKLIPAGQMDEFLAAKANNDWSKVEAMLMDAMATDEEAKRTAEAEEKALNTEAKKLDIATKQEALETKGDIALKTMRMLDEDGDTVEVPAGTEYEYKIVRGPDGKSQRVFLRTTEVAEEDTGAGWKNVTDKVVSQTINGVTSTGYLQVNDAGETRIIPVDAVDTKTAPKKGVIAGSLAGANIENNAKRSNGKIVYRDANGNETTDATSGLYPVIDASSKKFQSTFGTDGIKAVMNSPSVRGTVLAAQAAAAKAGVPFDAEKAKEDAVMAYLMENKPEAVDEFVQFTALRSQLGSIMKNDARAAGEGSYTDQDALEDMKKLGLDWRSSPSAMAAAYERAGAIIAYNEGKITVDQLKKALGSSYSNYANVGKTNNRGNRPAPVVVGGLPTGWTTN